MPKATLKIDIWTEGRGKRLPADLSDLAELMAPHAEHVARLCQEGYQSGQIVDERFSGWWTLERDSTPHRARISRAHREWRKSH